jgi:hypothetical protein
MSLSKQVLNMKSRQIAEEIVNDVRKKVNEEVLEYPGGDPWNEEDGGAVWLDNEVGMATEFLQKINISIVYPKWDIYDTVQIFQDKMATLLSESDLNFIRFFIIDLGGTSEDELFDLREKSKKEILEWFKEKGYVFENKICKVCRKEGKMKKCSGCLQAYYCSGECQKSDWKKHKKLCKNI